MREFADDNSESKESGGKLSKRIENTAGKGEIARYEQFFPFPTVFSGHVQRKCKNKDSFGKGPIVAILIDSILKIVLSIAVSPMMR